MAMIADISKIPGFEGFELVSERIERVSKTEVVWHITVRQKQDLDLSDDTTLDCFAEGDTQLES